MIVTGDAKVFAAFVKARGEISATVTKDARGNYGKYATLAALTEATAAPMAKYGCALVQEASVGETGVTIETWLVHESGGIMQFSPLTLPPVQRTPQAIGSAITYGRRYALAAICGIAPEDDDGDAATHARGRQERTQPPAAQQRARNAPPVQSEEVLGMDAAAFNRMVPGANDSNPSEDTPWYVIARDKLTNGVAKFADAALGYHRDGGPASAKQYQYLVGLLDSTIKQATGSDDGHKRVLAVLCQAEIGSNNPPSKTLASKMLDKVLTHKLVNGEKIENSDYDQSVVDACVTIYRAAEAVGTPALFA